MAIQSNVSDGLIPIDITDTVILEPQLARWVVNAAVLNNTASAPRTIQIYESPDLTSASGTLIATITLNALESLPIEEAIGQSYVFGDNLIAKATSGSLGDVNSRITTTWYSGTS